MRLRSRRWIEIVTRVVAGKSTRWTARSLAGPEGQTYKLTGSPVHHLARLIRTVRHLQVGQIVSRVRLRHGFSSILAPGACATGKLAHKLTMPVIEQHRTLILGPLGQVALSAHGFRNQIAQENLDWRLGPQAKERLWTLALHEQRWAWELGEMATSRRPVACSASAHLRRLLHSWLEECSDFNDRTQALAWNAYAVATRIGWWTRLHKLMKWGELDWWAELEPRFRTSYYAQAQFLLEHVEWDLRGNHLFRDAVGLAWASAHAQGPLAVRCRRTAIALTDEQIDEQILRDGGHFERSPMYHMQIMSDLLYLGLLLDDPYIREKIRATWTRLCSTLQWLTQPDGDVALLNDTQLGSDHTPALLFSAGQEFLGVSTAPIGRTGSTYLSEFGLVVSRTDPWVAFFDVGPIGPDYQPAHGHADSLTLEVSLRGERFIVDPGTFGYDDDPRRAYDRSTEAHNTVCIDRQNSSEVWAIFRVGRRATTQVVSFSTDEEATRAVAHHSGYSHLAGGPRHRRELLVHRKGPLVVTDWIEGRGSHLVSGGLLLAPQWRAKEAPGGWVVTNAAGQQAHVIIEAPGLKRRVERRPYHPSFGVEVECDRLTWTGEVRLPTKFTVTIDDG